MVKVYVEFRLLGFQIYFGVGIPSSSSCHCWTLSLHVSLSFIASGRSSGLNPVSSHCCCSIIPFYFCYAVQMENTTKMFRKYPIERQITLAEAKICEINIKIKAIMEFLLYQNISETQITKIQHKLSDGQKRLGKILGQFLYPPRSRHKKNNKEAKK